MQCASQIPQTFSSKDLLLQNNLWQIVFSENTVITYISYLHQRVAPPKPSLAAGCSSATGLMESLENSAQRSQGSCWIVFRISRNLNFNQKRVDWILGFHSGDKESSFKLCLPNMPAYF